MSVRRAELLAPPSKSAPHTIDRPDLTRKLIGMAQSQALN